ncbi:MAG: ABC transporter permease subunit [Eubacteriales bacterium]|jgi:putative spermidine/putrescine transport system permease protein
MKKTRKMKSGNSPATVIVIWLIMIYLLIPLAACVIYSLFSDWTGVVPHGFTLSAYAELFRNGAFWSALLETLLLCIPPILITILVVLLAMYAVVVYFPKLEKYIQIICMIPYTLQGVILSVSILSLYVGSDSILSNRLLMLMGAYCIIILPYMYQGIRNSMRAIDMKTLLEAAEMLGYSRLVAFFRVVVPNMMHGIIVSALLAVGIIFGDYVLIRNLSGSTVTNVQIYMYQAMKSDSMKSSAVFVMIMLVTFTIAALVLAGRRREAGAAKRG